MAHSLVSTSTRTVPEVALVGALGARVSTPSCSRVSQLGIAPEEGRVMFVAVAPMITMGWLWPVKKELKSRADAFSLGVDFFTVSFRLVGERYSAPQMFTITLLV